MTKKIRLRTKTPTEVRRTLNRVMNMMINNEIESKEANAIINACNAVLTAIRIDEQQKKIDEIEILTKELKSKVK